MYLFKLIQYISPDRPWTTKLKKKSYRNTENESMICKLKPLGVNCSDACNIKKKNKIHLFILWLCWILLAASGLFSRYGKWPSHPSGLSCCKAQAVGTGFSHGIYFEVQKKKVNKWFVDRHVTKHPWPRVNGRI